MFVICREGSKIKTNTIPNSKECCKRQKALIICQGSVKREIEEINMSKSRKHKTNDPFGENTIFNLFFLEN